VKTDAPSESVESVSGAWRYGKLSRVRSSFRRNRRIISEGGWLVAGQGASALAILVGVRLLTEVTPPPVYGAVGLLVGVLTLGRNLFWSPLCLASQRFYPEVIRQGKLGTLRRIVFRSLNCSNWGLSAVVIAVGVPLSAGRASSLLNVALLVGLLVVDNLRSMEIELFNVARRQRAYAILRSSEAWLKPVVALLMVRWLGPTVAALLLGYLLAGMITYASLFVFRIDRIGVAESSHAALPGSAEAGEMAGKIWRFSLPLAPLAIMDWVSSLSDRYLIGGLLGLESTGIYIAVYGLTANLFSLIQGTVEQLMRPYYFEAIAGGVQREARIVFARWIVLLASTSVLVIIAITLLRETIVALCLAEQYREAARLIPFLAIGHALWAISLTIEKVFHARQSTKWCLVVRTAGAFLSVAVAAPLIISFGMIGAAWAVPLYYGAQLALCIVLARRLIRTGSER
jgi:O-antigen/teichoic acid export membrane protein